jgi:stage II sporulation protein D
MKFLIGLILFICSACTNAQEVRIGLMSQLGKTKVHIETFQGGYTIYSDSAELGVLTSNNFVVSGNGMITITIDDTVYKSKHLRIESRLPNSALKIQSIIKKSKVHYYRGNVELVVNSKGRIDLINNVAMSDYLAGVIESEGGGGRHIEYYKVQALMSRTYALQNKTRHAKEGFQLCDGVHCQAYHNMLRHTPSIQEAVELTSGKVMIDGDTSLVTAYFSANCGGQTCEPSYIWNESVSYLSSFLDTFCIHTRQSTWKKSIQKQSWKSFIENEFGVYERDHHEQLYNFEQHRRKAFYIHPSLGIPLRDLRSKFRLKSTYFSTRLEGDEVVIEGRGFGHGVGLCQEGAMNMAKAGYMFSQIAAFYFDGIRIIDYQLLNK